jgi:septum formation inhibitor-activating ATPase MinD
LARVRQLESIARSSAEAGQAFELALADLGRQAAFDTEHFADGAFADRRVLGVLERSAKDAERSVRLHELALTRYDAATYRRGTMMLIAALALALATIVARPIYFALFPPVTYDPPDIVRPKGR